MASLNVTSWLSSAKVKFLEAQELLQKEPEYIRNADSNEPFQPYKHKYAAKEIFLELLNGLTELSTNLANSEGPKDDVLEKRLKSLHALLNYSLGVVYCDTEEHSVGEDHFNKAYHYLEKNDGLSDTCVLNINIKNNLGIIWSERGELDKAQSYLSEAVEVYEKSKLQLKEPPLSFVELFIYPNAKRENDDLDFGFGKAHVHSLYYLAQVYEKKSEIKLAASFCHKTLKWQMTHNSYNPLEWSLNCATLSQFFVGRERFEIARYFLACASYVLSTKNPSETEKPEEKELINHTKSDIARCWVNYCISLLHSSQEKISAENVSVERNIEKMFETLSTDYNMEDYILISPELVKPFEKEITFGYVENYEEARKVFLLAQNWISESKIYYTLSDRASDYAQIVQSHSKLFDHLAAFEDSTDRKCKMYKRRIDMLEETLRVLNQRYYLSLCQQLMFELGEIYSLMVQLKLAQYDPKKPNAHAIKKINALIDKGIATFQKLIDSMNSTNGETPEKYSEDVVRPALLARFYIGQLFSKYVVIGDPAKKLLNLQEMEKNYNILKDYVEKNQDQESCISMELDVLKEMVELIPCRMQQELSSTLY